MVKLICNFIAKTLKTYLSCFSGTQNFCYPKPKSGPFSAIFGRVDRGKKLHPVPVTLTLWLPKAFLTLTFDLDSCDSCCRGNYSHVLSRHYYYQSMDFVCLSVIRALMLIISWRRSIGFLYYRYLSKILSNNKNTQYQYKFFYLIFHVIKAILV